MQATARSADMRSYFAIPYAAPPVGDLRWRAPAPAAAWTAPIATTKSAASCVQTGDSPFRVGGDSEDCLYLDVHTPTGAGPFPVMVWIHGGAFNTGTASVYADPTPLVSKGVIVVGINYRLGAMGFLGHPALRDADGSVGNYGIMDQQAALRWVQANIAQFGGDPKNVTIFGESAGGFSVMTHLASPLSAGLFNKAIIESGAYGVGRQLTQAELEEEHRHRQKALTAGSLPGCGAIRSPPPACAACRMRSSATSSPPPSRRASTIPSRPSTARCCPPRSRTRSLPAATTRSPSSTDRTKTNSRCSSRCPNSPPAPRRRRPISIPPTSAT